MLGLLERPDARVIALGGGALGSERVRDALRGHTVVHLEIDAEDAWRRASGRGRPLARDRGRFEQLKQDREAVYESRRLGVAAADAARRACAGVLPRAHGARGGAGRARGSHGPRPPRASTRSSSAAASSASGFFHPPDGRRFAVTDENVAAVHTRRGRSAARRAARRGAEDARARGGGAAVPRGVGRGAGRRPRRGRRRRGGRPRGILRVRLPARDALGRGSPRPLVAQVDSAYGGKTGVDLPEAKNYVGAYHHPAAVLVDPSVLETLPAEEAAAGYAEVVKTALIAGGPLWARVREGGPVDDETIWRCLRTKLAVVAEDERDAAAARC